jgi:hypothetical protein
MGSDGHGKCSAMTNDVNGISGDAAVSAERNQEKQ